MGSRISKYVFLVALLSVVMLSCSDNKNKGHEKGWNEFKINIINNEYKKVKNIFSPEEVSHFPEEIKDNYITHTEIVSPEAGIVRLDLTVRYDSLESVQDILNKAIAVYNSEDTCLLVANRFARKEDYGQVSPRDIDTSIINRTCYEGKYPIPNFWQSDYYSDSTECKLDKGFLIYVLDAKPGIYNDERYLSHNPYLPEKWEHGFSKGISVDPHYKILIYWVIVW